MEEILIHNLSELESFAKKLNERISENTIVCLHGDLGAGKTTFAKYIINELSYPNIHEVTSPTFNLVHLYDTNKGKLWHFDLYRLKYAEEAYELGIEEAINNIAIIEWPEIIMDILPNTKTIHIFISFGEEENIRKLKITPNIL